MKKSLYRLALMGLATGLCLSASGCWTIGEEDDDEREARYKKEREEEEARRMNYEMNQYYQRQYYNRRIEESNRKYYPRNYQNYGQQNRGGSRGCAGNRGGRRTSKNEGTPRRSAADKVVKGE